MPSVLSRSVPCVLCCLLAVCSSASARVESAEPVARPRVALVLSGGGARGFAHVGVLRVLERLRVPVDVVVGTSMGAAVGGAWAAGATPEELAVFVLGSDWDALLADRPVRPELPIRRRVDDIDVPSRVELGVGPQGLVAPTAAAGSQALESALRRLLPPGAGERPASAQPIPFASVATELRTGERVTLHDAPLFAAIRASLSVPGLFPPFRFDGRLLVDGGLVRNLPVDLARALGADVVIAVNVGTPLADASRIGDALGVTQQMLAILTEQNVRRSLRELGERDVLIAPQLGDATFTDFSSGARAIAAGERAAEAMAARLAPLALSDAEHQARARRLADARDAQPRPGARVLRSVTVTGTRIADPHTLAAESGLAVGRPITPGDVVAAADRLYGRGDFERVDARVGEGPQGLDVTLLPVETPRQRSRLRLGLAFGTDFREDHEVSVAALHVLPWLNPWGGELRTLVQAGSTARLAIDAWQPLGRGAPWFANASARYRSRTEAVYAMDRALARVGMGGAGLGLSVGRLVGDLGYASLGWARLSSRTRLVMPDVRDEPFTDTLRTVGTVNVLLDTREPIGFPERGGLLAVAYEWPLQRPAEGLPGDAWRIQALQAFRLGPIAGHVYAELGRSRGDADVMPLGGFLRLSGTPRNSLYSDAVLFGRFVLGVPVGAMPVGLGGTVRVGLSLEGGNGYDTTPGEPASLGGLRTAGSVFTSVDTRFGPLFFAAGKTEGIRPSLYLLLGPYW